MRQAEQEKVVEAFAARAANEPLHSRTHIGRCDRPFNRFGALALQRRVEPGVFAVAIVLHIVRFVRAAIVRGLAAC